MVESRILAGRLALCLALAVMALGLAFIRFARSAAAEFRPPVGSRWPAAIGLFRPDYYSATGRSGLVKAGLCLAVLFLAMPIVPATLDWLQPPAAQPRGASDRPVSGITMSVAFSAMFFASSLVAWLALILLSAVQFLLAQRHARAAWPQVGWRRLFDASVFDVEGRTLRTNGRWLLLAGALAFGVAILLLAILRNLPPAPN